jgi:exosortase B
LSAPTEPAPAAAGLGAPSWRARAPAALLLLGLAILYVPTLWGASQNLWRADEYAHEPMVIAVSAWWFWHRRAQLRAAAGPGAGLGGWLLLLLGAAIYAVGRAQQVWMLEIGSSIPVLAGALAVLFGWPAVRTVRFSLLFLFFALPLPGAIVDELTAPLKRGVSVVAEEILYAAGYPVARDGVVLSLGQYKLLIADACSGLYSMTSLLALAVVYVNVARRASRPRNALVLLGSLPFAFGANVVRVVLLCLITYYWGDAAGQGFLHGTAGVVMFATALLLLLAADAALAAAGRRVDEMLRLGWTP